jgi:hypothetical protein
MTVVSATSTPIGHVPAEASAYRTLAFSFLTVSTSDRGPIWLMTSAAIAPPRRPQVARSRLCV